MILKSNVSTKIVFTVAVKNELQAEALNSTFILYKYTILSTANIIVTGISKYKATVKYLTSWNAIVKNVTLTFQNNCTIYRMSSCKILGVIEKY